MTLANWQIIQKWAGSTPDGIPGPATARAIIAKAGLAEEPKSALVRGTGRNIKRIFVHCTATREGQDIDAATIKRWHINPRSKGGRGWSDIGYHFVVALDGDIEVGRPESRIGSHVSGFNTGSIGVVYVGGLDRQGKPKDTRTDAQTKALHKLITELLEKYPGAEIMGHRDASPDKDGDGVIESFEWVKACPSFDVRKWWYGE